MSGALVGTLEGAIGNFVVPTSIRMINDKLDGIIDDIFTNSEEGTAESSVGSLTFDLVRLTTRLGLHGGITYKIIEDVANGGEVEYWPFIVSNAVSLGYEVYRIVKDKKQE